jgi:hypothetical protein
VTEKGGGLPAGTGGNSIHAKHRTQGMGWFCGSGSSNGLHLAGLFEAPSKHVDAAYVWLL